MSEKIYKWGIIGCGNVTEVKSGPAYQNVKGFELHAVMRRDIAKAEDYAKRHNVPKFYGDAGLLINDDEVDAVYIATPPDTHAYYALKVAEAGKICCIEKPMASSYKECKQITEAFSKKNLPLFVAYYRRSLPRYNQVKAWLSENKIGNVRHISWHLSKPANAIDLSEKYNWRTDKKIAYAGYFDDLASHGLDLFIQFLGKIKIVNGISTNQQGLYTAKDAVVGNWLHESGITGSGSWNFGAEKREDRVEIYGDKGKITFSVFDEAPIVLENGEEKTEMEIENPKHIQFNHVQNMRSHLMGDLIHPSSGESAMYTSWVLEKLVGI